MLYPGDNKVLCLSIIRSDGAAPSVTVAPLVQVVQLSSRSIVLGATAMTLIAGTQAVYTYSWPTTGQAKDDYAAIVSYVSDGITVNGRLLECFRLGDTNIAGPVALDATVAKDATAAKDATVAHAGDLAAVSPDSSAAVLAIKAKTDNLPADPASTTALSQIGALVQDLRDYQFGIWTIDKTRNPQVLTVLSPNHAVLATFTLSDSATATQRAPQ